MSDTSKTDLPYRPCVGVMLMNADGKVFVGQRKDSDVAAWQMPQGGIDDGEDPQTAALRELWEETGVTADLVTVEDQTSDWLTYDLPPELVGKVWKGRYRGQTQKWYALEFEGSEEEIDIGEKPTQKAEFDQWRWETSDKLPGLIIPFKRKVYSAVIEEFSDLLG